MPNGFLVCPLVDPCSGIPGDGGDQLREGGLLEGVLCGIYGWVGGRDSFVELSSEQYQVVVCSFGTDP